MWIDLLDEGISLLLLVILGLVLYRGFKKNQTLLSEREELLKRYLFFRGDQQVRLKIYEGDEKLYRELIKTISNSWKNFKKTYDQYLLNFAQNTNRTKLFLKIITLGLLINSLRLIAGEYLFSSLKIHMLYTIVRELSSYVLVLFSFFLLRMQTQRFHFLKGKSLKMDQENLFFPNNSVAKGEEESLYNEFNPIESVGGEDGKENQDTHR
jgi:hypothetical protein